MDTLVGSWVEENTMRRAKSEPIDKPDFIDVMLSVIEDDWHVWPYTGYHYQGNNIGMFWLHFIVRIAISFYLNSISLFTNY